MRLTPDQAEKAIEYLGNGARIVEASRMVSAPWPAFAADWNDGRADSEAGTDTVEADFYRRAQAARSRHCAVKRATAAATAGSRESADLLAYVRALESEQEPLADDAETPNAIRLTLHDDPAVVKAARAVGDATREMLRALTARDERARESRATA